MGGILVVTGGGRGIGAACARQGALRGYAVAVNYAQRPARAAAVVEEIRRGGG
ncbi:MAG: SDR family NAD(P)-dependent oxidoreductase, partial [Alphaproteobacteria bacterium]